MKLHINLEIELTPAEVRDLMVGSLPVPLVAETIKPDVTKMSVALGDFSGVDESVNPDPPVPDEKKTAIIPEGEKVPVCKICGAPFEYNRKRKTVPSTCGPACRKQWDKQRQRKYNAEYAERNRVSDSRPRQRNCAVCQQPFTDESRTNTRKYCVNCQDWAYANLKSKHNEMNRKSKTHVTEKPEEKPKAKEAPTPAAALPEQPSPVPESASMFEKIKAERAQKKYEQQLHDSLIDPVKIDWKKAKGGKKMHEVEEIV